MFISMLRTILLLYCIPLLLKTESRSAINSASQRATTIVYRVGTSPLPLPTDAPLTRYERGEEDYDEAVAQARGMMSDDYSGHHQDLVVYQDPHAKLEVMKEEKKAVKTDPWAGYYDFIINEGSFKFWAAFQLATALLLVYSACAAIYYAKLNPITTDYDYYDDFLFRSMGRSVTGDVTLAPPTTGKGSSSWFGMNSQTFQRILTAITSKKFD